jgi:hypothetical protein
MTPQSKGILYGLAIFVLWATAFLTPFFFCTWAKAQSVSVPTTTELDKTNAAVAEQAKRISAIEILIKKLMTPADVMPLPPIDVQVPNAAGVSAQLCSVVFKPVRAMEAFTDGSITTRLWRDEVTACGEKLTLDWWHYDAKHWSLTIRRALDNPTAPRKAALALKSTLFVDGKLVAATNGNLFEMQVAYLEQYRLPPRFTVPDLIKARKVPPINMFRAPIQNVFVDGHRDVKKFQSLGDGPLARGMPGVGDRSDLGVVHEWCASYISYSDIKADYWWQACTDAALDTANVPWHVTRKDGLPTLWDDAEFKGKGFDARNDGYEPNTTVAYPPAPHFRITQNVLGQWEQTTKIDAWQIDDAHQTFAQLVPYMATRHPVFLWLAQSQASSLLGGYNCPVSYCKMDTVEGRSLPLGTQIRGTAWSFRTLSQAVLMTPESPPAWLHPKSRYQAVLELSERRLRADILEPSTRYWQGLSEGRAGALQNPEGCGLVKATGRVSCGIQMWMYDFWAQGLGFATWAGVKGVEPSYKLLTDQLVYRYGVGAQTRKLGAPFTMVFSDPFSPVEKTVMANDRNDLVRFTPSENLAYGSGKPLIVGTGDNLGEWPQMGWHVQGNAAFCSLNGDARCNEIARWWEEQFKLQKAANPQWYGGWEYAKYRIKFD